MQVVGEGRRSRDKANNLVFYKNLLHRTAVQPVGVTSLSVYDGGGLKSQQVVETPVDVSLGMVKKKMDLSLETVKKKINDVTYQLYCAECKHRYRLIHVDKLKLCTAATQSPDSAATQPIIH